MYDGGATTFSACISSSWKIYSSESLELALIGKRKPAEIHSATSSLKRAEFYASQMNSGAIVAHPTAYMSHLPDWDVLDGN